MKWMSFVCVVAVTFIVGCSSPSGKVLVNINGEKITEGDLKFLGEINPRIQAQISNPAGQKRILDNLVEQTLMYDEALKQGINRDEKVKAKVDLYRKVIIAQSLVDAEVEKTAKKHYDEHQDEFKKLKLSEIMIAYASPDEIKKAKKDQKLNSEEAALKIAESVKARLDKGENFDTVAKEVSDDATTKARGGDLGLVGKGDKRIEAKGMAPIIDKAFEMKVGEIAGPIKTDKGYYIITVTRGIELDPFEQAKESIAFKTQGETRQNLLAKLKKDAKITWPEEEKQKAEAEKKTKDAEKATDKASPEAAKAEEKK